MEGINGDKTVNYNAQDLMITHMAVEEDFSAYHTHMDAHVLQDFKKLTVTKVHVL